MSGDCITIMCVDDHALVLDGLALVIDLQPDMRVVATATRGQGAVESYKKHRPDVTLMDLQLPDMSGVEAIRAIRQDFPEARIAVLTMYQGDHDVYTAFAAGAGAYVLKDAHSEELVRVIRDLHAGRSIQRASALGGLQALATNREQQVLQLLADGKRNKEIAAALGISEETVHTHLKNVYEKLGVSDRTLALTIAMRRGIIHLR